MFTKDQEYNPQCLTEIHSQQTSADPKRMRTLFLSRLLRAVRPRHVTANVWAKAVQELGNVFWTFW